MVELVDTLDLGSNGFPCKFESCYPYQKSLFFRTGTFYAGKYRYIRRRGWHTDSKIIIAKGKCQIQLKNIKLYM